MSEDQVLVEAVLAFGDVQRGDKILISPERAEALKRYLKPIGPVVDVPIPLTVFEQEELDDQSEHLQGENERLDEGASSPQD